MHLRTVWLAALALLDLLLTSMSIAVFATHYTELDFQNVTLNGTLPTVYSFTRSPLDLGVLCVIRVVLVFIGLVLLLRRNVAFLQNCSLVSLGVCLSFVSFSVVKLLAFAEDDAMLENPGVWMLTGWSFVASSLLRILWSINVAALNEDSSSSSSSSSIIKDDDEDSETSSLAPAEKNNNEKKNDSDESPDSPALSRSGHVWRLFKFCLSEWRWFSVGFAFLIAYSWVRILIPLYTGEVISSIVKAQGYDALVKSVTAMAALSFLCAFFGGFRAGCFTYGTDRIEYRVRRDLFDALVKQEIAFFDATKTGEIVSRLTADCEVISKMMSMNFNVFTRHVIVLIGCLGFMFRLSWKLTAVSFVFTPIILFITKTYMSFFDKLYEAKQETVAQANQTAEEVLSTLRTVRSFASEKRESARFEQKLLNTLKMGWKGSIGEIGATWAGEMSNSAVLVAVLAYGGHLVISGRMSSDNFIAFLMYQMQIGEHLFELGWVVTEVMKSVGASRKVFEYMRRKPRILNDGQAKPEIKGEIVFDDVSFKYPTRPKHPVLEDFTLKISPGETIALVGPSGGGKSSIVSLLQHFYSPEKGVITLDGVLISDIDYDYFHKKVALVSQEPVLYDGSIRSNISYGCEATEEEILEAAEMANVASFVSDLPDGYDTNCGEKGVQMSGGQKQRVAIARALVRKPAVLILDEATSALDAESEAAVQEAINRCSINRTVIIIAHRLSTIENADRIIVIQKGRIVQIGSHTELMADDSGLYQTLVKRQLRNEPVQ